ncbi:carboxymuconolactone decarboxylase family protein [Fodinibius salsisoli]|uniref:Peroxidase-related enzyme n=1 Tax=Fodinibius salsisoli TaxID=2820877 RepID=A0ABT3PI58_9BACT|nr:peroxidase-related enzyme [Fodinibius salsisoli]MCW9705602.1 peroxidase-related enzyme [Fodinibius salsisoli]
MAHINLDNQMPGIVGLLTQFKETAKPLTELAQVLLRGESTLSEGERELIASLVSSRNECEFCMRSHSATASHLLDGNKKLVEQVREDFRSAPVSDKLKTLLNIAAQVQKGGRHVSEEDIAAARQEGATDKEIHDTVLIAAAFCLYNRYVDGLETFTPEDESAYDEHGKELATEGYLKFN